MKTYKVLVTTEGNENGHTYNNARVALNVYNKIRGLFARFGYIVADAGSGMNCRAELWIKDGCEDKNIEIFAVES